MMIMVPHYKKFALVTVIIVTHSLTTLISYEPLEYGTYPTPTFTKIEKICTEITIDLQAIRYNPNLHELWVDNNDYLRNQLLVLSHSLEVLIDNPEELQTYLLEDINYLKTIFTSLCTNFIILYEKCDDPKITALQAIVSQCATYFDTLYGYNKETVAYTM